MKAPDRAWDEEDGPPPHPAGTPLAPGYAVVGHVRRGEDLDVYDIWSDERGCACVAKTLRPDRLASWGARRALMREGRLLLRLTHPHIVRAYALVARPTPVLVLETLTGATLARLIADHHRLPVADAAHLGLHLCSAIGYLHRHNVLHLDLKPSNIMSDRGIAKVLDLSIARAPGPGRRGVGTPQYLSPEQECGRAFGPATDIWGIGIVLFEALTGDRPRADGGPDARQRDTVRRHRRVPAPVATAVDRCLARDPADRPTIAELHTMLALVVAP